MFLSADCSESAFATAGPHIIWVTLHGPARASPCPVLPAASSRGVEGRQAPPVEESDARVSDMPDPIRIFVLVHPFAGKLEAPGTH